MPVARLPTAGREPLLGARPQVDRHERLQLVAPEPCARATHVAPATAVSSTSTMGPPSAACRASAARSRNVDAAETARPPELAQRRLALPPGPAPATRATRAARTRRGLARRLPSAPATAAARARRPADAVAQARASDAAKLVSARRPVASRAAAAAARPSRVRVGQRREDRIAAHAVGDRVVQPEEDRGAPPGRSISISSQSGRVRSKGRS